MFKILNLNNSQLRFKTEYLYEYNDVEYVIKISDHAGGWLFSAVDRLKGTQFRREFNWSANPDLDIVFKELVGN